MVSVFTPSAIRSVSSQTYINLTTKLIFAASALSTQYLGVRAKTCLLGIRMCIRVGQSVYPQKLPTVEKSDGMSVKLFYTFFTIVI